MLRRVMNMVAAVTIAIGVSAPAHALLPPAQQPNDLYVLTKSGKIFRLPGGTGSPGTPELDLAYSDAAALLFDPAGDQFIAGPGIFAIMGEQIRRIPLNLANSGTGITGTETIGGFGIGMDLFRPSNFAKSDLLVADSNPSPGARVIRIAHNGTQSTAASVTPQGFNFVGDVEVNNITGHIYVAVQEQFNAMTGARSGPGAILIYNNDGTFRGNVVLADGKITLPLQTAVNPQVPLRMAFDTADQIPYYDLVVVAIDTSNVKKIYLIDVDNDRPSGDRIKFVVNAPSTDTVEDDLTISPAGKIIYASHSADKVYSIDPTNGALTELGGVPDPVSVAFASRSSFWSQDYGYAVGSFTRTTGPNGRPAILCKITDPEFSSGLVRIEARGSNLRIYAPGVTAAPLTWVKTLDFRWQIQCYTFIAEKIDPYAGASIQVIAHDTAGRCGDPPVESMITTRGKPDPITMDLTELQLYGTEYRTVCIDNNGVDKLTLQCGGETYKLNADAKMAADQTVDVRGQKSTIKIALYGKTTLIIKNDLEMTVSVTGTGNPHVGDDCWIEVN